MKQMYKAMPNSPVTHLAEDIPVDANDIAILDDSKLPEGPNLAILGSGVNSETISYEIKANGKLRNVTRGVEGAPKPWSRGTEVARYHTAYDHNSVIQNINNRITKKEFQNHRSDYLQLKDDLSNVLTSSNLLDVDNFEVGSLRGSTGEPDDLTTRIRCKDFNKVSKGDVIVNLNISEFKLAIHFFSLEDKTWQGLIGFSKNITKYVFEKECYIKLVIAYDDDREVTLEDRNDILSNFVAYTGILSEESEENNNRYTRQIYNDTGKEFIFKFPVVSGGSYLSDHTFVKDELWVFPVSNDSHTNFVDVNRYSVDLENKNAQFLGSFKHNWGHCNTVDYCKVTDSIILGNGGGSDNLEPNEIYIFENASNMQNETTVNVSTAIKLEIEKDGFDWGKQLNVVWGESNAGKHNIIYAISNNDVTQFIHKIILGQGGNQLENGTFISGKTGLQFNGTYKIIKQYTYPYDRYYCNQGTQFYNGILYEGFGHDAISHFEKILNKNGTVTAEIMQERIYDDTGNEINFTVEGLAIKNDHLFIGSIKNEIYVFKL